MIGVFVLFAWILNLRYASRPAAIQFPEYIICGMGSKGGDIVHND